VAQPHDPEDRFFSLPPPRPRQWRWLRTGLLALVAVTVFVVDIWAPWRPLDRAAGHHPAARLVPNLPSTFDPAVRHKGAVVALAAGEKADHRRALLQLTIAEPSARVALVDEGDEIAWSAEWPPTGSTYRLDVDPGRWRYVQSREDLRGLHGPLIEERQQLDLRAGQVWELRTTTPTGQDGGATFGRPAVQLP
jgi:hypothetical protein